MICFIQRAKTAAAFMAAVLLIFFAGFMAGRKHKTQIPTKEPPAPQIKHAEGSITLARVNTPPPPPLPMPTGASTRIRSAMVELKPLPEASRIQVDLVEMKDGTERVTVKGDAVVGGQDFSFQVRPTLPVKKWTVGAGVGFKNYTLIGLRSVGPFEIGGIIQRDRMDRRAWDAQIVAVWRF